jgi:hypothetical protein
MGVLWQIPATSVKNIVAHPGTFGILSLTIETEQGDFQIETVTPQNFEKLQSALQIQATYVQAEKKVNPTKYKNWYEDPSLRAHVETYSSKEQKKMQKNVELFSRYGWVPQNQTAQSGHHSAKKMIGGAIVAGVLTAGVAAPLGALAGAGRSKDSITITFVRSQEWLDQQQRG